jgi:hypothetical protein
MHFLSTVISMISSFDKTRTKNHGASSNSFPFRCLNRIIRYSAFRKCVCYACPRWAYGPGTDVCTECECQELMRTLIVLNSPCMHDSACTSVYQIFKCSFIRNWCVHWACASWTDVYTKHTRQELLSAWSPGVQNWCLHWAQSLQNMLSIHVRNWCVHWVCTSGTDVYPAHTVHFSF